ncbi:MAG: DUF3006 domain-containing protein [Synergistaceae bacterium]|jgi:hypothetical protein|nr:DUF3006 domain-containing protein [Synergistaceae bacterium]
MDKPRFFVDAVRDGCARLLTDGGDSLTVPASTLPDGAREGDWLCVSFELDPERKAETRRAIDDLYSGLGDNP